MSVQKRLVPRNSGIRFAIVGMANSFFGLLTIYGAIIIFGLNDVAANFLGYAAGITLSFFLNSTWSFGYSGRLYPAIIKFIFVIIFAYIANLLTVMWLIKVFQLNNLIAHAAGIVPYTAIGYLGSRYIVFRSASIEIAGTSIQEEVGKTP